MNTANRVNRSEATELEVLKVHPQHSLGTWRDVFILIWREMTLPGLSALGAACDKFKREHPQGMALLTVVEAAAPMPSSEARPICADFLRGLSGAARASAVCQEGTGFRAAAVRSVAVGLSLLARQSYPHQVFADVPQGASWLCTTIAQTLPESTNAQHLIAAVECLRLEQP